MRTEYESTLVEQTVFLACRRDPALERELHAATDPIYAIPDGRAREAKFHKVHAALFVQLKLDSTLLALLGERPLIASSVGHGILREAANAKAESAELFVKRSGHAPTPDDQTLIIQVRPESLLDPDRLAVWLRRELLHVSDMLDEDFDYAPDGFEGVLAKQNLHRDRYRVLWDAYVEGRLAREGWADEAYVDRLRQMFGRAFKSPSAGRNDAAFAHVFGAEQLTHHQIRAWAGAPQALFDEPADRQASLAGAS